MSEVPINPQWVTWPWPPRGDGYNRPRHSARIVASTPLQLWPIFICYRRVDGSPTARRLYEILDKRDYTGPDGQPIQLDVYLDETVPGVADWKAMHRPYLEKARALIVICTPGAKLNEGPDDWVHQEIEWWLRHRHVAPILIDPLMEGLRYVPTQIAQRWPDIQRIPLVEREWAGLAGTGLQQKVEDLRRHVVGALLPSGAAIYEKELVDERQRSLRLKRALVGVVALLGTVAAAGAYAVNRQRAALRSERVATASLLDTRAASAFNESRLIDARARRSRLGGACCQRSARRAHASGASLHPVGRAGECRARRKHPDPLRHTGRHQADHDQRRATRDL